MHPLFDVALLNSYPDGPGVYLMKDGEGAVLYIGKAKHLKMRLKQYFPGGDGRVQIPFLLAKVVDIQTIITATEAEALLLEARLIRQHRPPYNILLKDDRSPLLIRLTTDHPFPLIEMVRGKDLPQSHKGRLFGPFARQMVTRHLFDLVVRVCMLRQCSDEEFRRRTAPCLLYQLRRCTAPCVGSITQEEYAASVHLATSVLSGKTAAVEAMLRSEMQAASDRLEFEKAAVWHRKLELLSAIHEEKVSEKTKGTSDTDVVGCWQEGKRLALALMHYRQSSLVFGESWCFDLEEEGVSSDCEEQLVAQYYLSRADLEGVKEILIPTGQWPLEPLHDGLCTHFNAQILIKRPTTPAEHALVALACDNARAKLFQTPDIHRRKTAIGVSIQEHFGLKRLPRIIDCFDASHFAGKGLVAACVGYVDGDRETSRYRKFIMRGVTIGNDLAMLDEAVRRRYSKGGETEELPDLILVDGGKEQLASVLRTLREVGFLDVDVVGIAKEHGRHDRGMTREQFFVAGRDGPFLFPERSSELHFLQRIRDEAHRFAIQFQKKRRLVTHLSSRLDGIKGIGEVKRHKLLMAFRGVEDIAQATVEEIMARSGLNHTDAQAIFHTFHR